MIRHYLEIAFRNLIKHKAQTVISIIGLPVRFTRFALSTFWIYYGMTYDAFLKGSERTYISCEESVLENSSFDTSSPYPLSTYLKRDFPEIEAVCALTRWRDVEISVGGQAPLEGIEIGTDSCFMNMFDISAISGNTDFMHSDEKITLTKDVAMRLFGSTDALGQKTSLRDSSQAVCAIPDGLEDHNNLSFGFWTEGAYLSSWIEDWQNLSFMTIPRFHKKVDFQLFQKKLNEYAQKKEKENIFIGKCRLIPITGYYYPTLNTERTVEFYYLILFAVVSGLVILCSLFNYFSLFSTRMHVRVRELELRKVCGSSHTGLSMLLSVEYLLVLLLPGLLGMTFIELFLSIFKGVSNISGNVYVESFFYLGGVVITSLILFLPLILKKNYHSQKAVGKALYRKISAVLQLIISILFIFSISVIMGRLFLLNNVDLDWERENIAVFQYLYPSDSFSAITGKVEQVPYTREVLEGNYDLLLQGARISWRVTGWDGKQSSTNQTNLGCLAENEEIIRFYHLKLLKGEMSKKDDAGKVVINETAVKSLDMHDSIGKKIYQGKDRHACIIVRVIKDLRAGPSVILVKPVTLIGQNNKLSDRKQIIVKYHEGQWRRLKQKTEDLFIREYPGTEYVLTNIKERYNEYLELEYILLKLLGFVSVVCVIISILGIYSLVTLTCEQQSKEIAIRKVNGVIIRDILILFLKEYLILLAAASLMAFPIGYIVMKHWLENYVERTEISAWMCGAIFITVGLIIFFSIMGRIWKTARQNPTEVIKSE